VGARGFTRFSSWDRILRSHGLRIAHAIGLAAAKSARGVRREEKQGVRGCTRVTCDLLHAGT
jgi:hypothetical protein